MNRRPHEDGDQTPNPTLVPGVGLGPRDIRMNTCTPSSHWRGRQGLVRGARGLGKQSREPGAPAAPSPPGSQRGPAALGRGYGNQAPICISVPSPSAVWE